MAILKGQGPVAARASMLLCARASFLSSTQMRRLCRCESFLTEPKVQAKLADSSDVVRLFAYIEWSPECSVREAVALLRALKRS